LCQKESYLLELIRYIHLNPVRAGIIEDPGRYPWTGHLAYLGKEKNNLIDSDMVLGQFAKKKSLARRRYRQFVLDGMKTGHEEKYYRVKDQRYLGEDEFVDKVEGLKKKHEPFYWDISLERIVLEVLREMGIPRDQVYSLSRGRKGALGRNLAAYLARRLAGFRVIEVARHFNREPMTLSLGVQKVESLLQSDRGLAKKVERMERNLKEKSKRKYFITIA
jgi:hypothetical protein